MTEYKDYGFSDTESAHTQGYIFPELSKLLHKQQNKCILDLGCGNGSLVRKLLDHGFEAYGLDASASGIGIASEKDPGRFALLDLSGDNVNIPGQFRDIPFDTIISTEVIEHLYDPRSFIMLCKSVLPENGQLILSTPYHGYLKNLLIALTGSWDKHMNPLWDGGHIKMWSLKTITALLEEQGFRVTDFRGCGRVPYLWKSMLVRAVLK